ncbi:MAG: GntR family transcriptional regulator [Rhizobiaceae bacterium]|nr:GntR family transcriptional regulator [Rhizobiaceae bacterium]
MPKQIASEVEKSLRQRIAAGEWSHDGQLPAERDIAKEYAVARNTARRAINALVDEGVISRHVGRGTFVRPADEVDMNDILQRVTGVSPTDMMTVRRLVEPQAAAIAVTMASASDLDAIVEAHEMAKAERDPAKFEYWDAQIHHRIFKAARNELLMSLHDILRVIRNRDPWIELKRKRFSEERRLGYCAQHEDIVRMLKDRDAAGASDAMLVHMNAIEMNLFGRLN